jgi:hypothetical protein
MRRITPVLVLAVTLIAPATARGAILTFEFFGVAGAGSTINLGAGAVDVSGLEFTAFGQTINDIDLFSGGVVGDGVGFFAATATYDFGPVFGAFTTDVGADFYGQNCGTAASVTCALLSTVNAGQGFRMDFAPAVAGDADFGIPLGTQVAVGSLFIARTQTNASGHSLTITPGSIRSATVTATDVPEPASLLLMGAGTLIAARRMRSRRR